MPVAALIYPHQLYEHHPALERGARVILIEEPLFFTQYSFHRQKLLFHRATMAGYAAELSSRGFTVETVDSQTLACTGSIAPWLQQRGITAVRYVDPCDDWLELRLARSLQEHGIAATMLDDPAFLTSSHEMREFVDGRTSLFFTEFYIRQRKRLNLLIDKGKPAGGQWSFDPLNRRKLPKGHQPPEIVLPANDEFTRAARSSVRRDFPDSPGDDADCPYPTSRKEARRWLQQFVRQRLTSFGDYEDAISSRHPVLYHSVLTPLLNTGLLTPREVIDAVLAHADGVPLNSLEGFVRQVIGWREFVRLVYRTFGRRQRSRNFWGFTHPMPEAFYHGTTGLAPFDHVVRTVLQTGYCHHIERLMVLGNLMLLCEIHPDAVYRWFMELFIDAYDWVMVPNVYGMSQFADGGLMTTKPYLSGSAYLRRMSDFPSGEWGPIWDALYWRFIERHEAFFAANPRTAIMVKMKARLGRTMTEHRRIADQFLDRLHGSGGR